VLVIFRRFWFLVFGFFAFLYKLKNLQPGARGSCLVFLTAQEAEIKRIVGLKPTWTVSKIPNTKQGWWSGSTSRVPIYKG
jgi:hypothetical protein